MILVVELPAMEVGAEFAAVVVATIEDEDAMLDDDDVILLVMSLEGVVDEEVAVRVLVSLALGVMLVLEVRFVTVVLLEASYWTVAVRAEVAQAFGRELSKARRVK